VADIFREVDEDIRRMRYEKLWRAYGKYVIAAALIFVIAVAVGTFWRQQVRAEREAQSARFAQALELARAGNDEQASAAFAQLATDAGSGYAALARLQEAAALARQGRKADAVIVYDRLAADSSLSKLVRDLATLLGGLHSLDAASYPDVRRRVERLTVDTSPWRFSAREILAVAAVKGGDMAAAQTLLKQISDDPEAPGSARARAAELLALVGPTA
jgi:hypothetical protein